MRLVAPSQWVAAPWRNGGGVTHEIAREGPPDAFSWRVSVADVAQAGPFSAFPGVDRVIALLEGAGFSLHDAGRLRVTLSRPGEAYAFSGDDAVTCTLVDGPVRDLNVMVDRARWRVSWERQRAVSHEIAAEGDRLLVFVLDGSADVANLGRADRHALVVSDRDVRLTGGPFDVVIARLGSLAT